MVQKPRSRLRPLRRQDRKHNASRRGKHRLQLSSPAICECAEIFTNDDWTGASSHGARSFQSWTARAKDGRDYRIRPHEIGGKTEWLLQIVEYIGFDYATASKAKRAAQEHDDSLG